MRILHVFDHSLPLHSGYSFRSAAILREQRRLGWTTVQVTGPKHACAGTEETVDGVPYVRTRHMLPGLGKVPVINQVDVIMALRRQIGRIAADFAPNIIHAHSPCLNGLAANAVARRNGVPFVYEMRASWEDAAVSHGTTTPGSIRYRMSHALETHVLRSADAVTTICEGLRQDILSRGIPAERATIIPNAVDLDQFSGNSAPDPLLRARFCPPGTTLLGFLGSFYAYEGLHVLIAAMPALLAWRPNMKLLLCGGGPEEQALRAQAMRLGLGDRVLFVGRVPHQEIPAYYAAVDLLVYPRVSIDLTEKVTPLKPLEAMAQGRLLIASDVGGHRELITDGFNGFLFPPGDNTAIVTGVRAALSHPDRQRIALNGQEFVRKHRNWRGSVQKYEPVYRQLISGNTVSTAPIAGHESR